MESRWESILASIFNGFWWILGAKLGPSWEGKSSQDRPRQAKTGQDKASEGKGRERKRKGRDWKGKVWKSVEGEFLRGGGAGHDPSPYPAHVLETMNEEGTLDTCRSSNLPFTMRPKSTQKSQQIGKPTAHSQGCDT